MCFRADPKSRQFQELSDLIGGREEEKGYPRFLSERGWIEHAWWDKELHMLVKINDSGMLERLFSVEELMQLKFKKKPRSFLSCD